MDLMTVQEAAAALRVPEATLRWWLQSGTAPRSARIGRRRMFRQSDLEKFVNDKFEADRPTVRTVEKPRQSPEGNVTRKPDEKRKSESP